MKQLIILDHFLTIKDVVITDVTPQVFDCIVPQKTTFVLKKNEKISQEDICLIRDGTTRNVEYIGIIDVINTDKTTKLEMLPFISICDNELRVDTLNACKIEETGYDYSVQDYITDQIETNFVNTDDIYNKYPITVVDYTREKVYYKAVDETSNLLDVLNEIYLNTGLYIDFTVSFDAEGISGIICGIYNANEQEAKQIRFDNPQIVDKVEYKYSQYGNYSKCTIEIKDTGRKFDFYLRQDNKITTNPEDKLRIKKIKSKNVEFTAQYNTEDELAEALVLMAQKTLCGDAFAYSIEFNVLRKAISDWKFRQRCTFLAPDKIYESYITNIQYLNDKEARVTLGAYRYTLTDKFKNLIRSKKEIGDSLNGIAVSDALGSTTFWFSQDENGNLWLNYPENEEQPNFVIENDVLYYEYENTEPDFVIEEDGELVYKY